MSNTEPENDRHGGGVYHGKHCALCGDGLSNDLERDTGVCDGCAELAGV